MKRWSFIFLIALCTSCSSEAPTPVKQMARCEEKAMCDREFPPSDYKTPQPGSQCWLVRVNPSRYAGCS
jgi:hypothetical protein